MLENHSSGKRSHKETRKAVLFMKQLWSSMYLWLKNFAQLYISLLFCVCLLNLFLAKLPKVATILISPRPWESCETHKLEKAVVLPVPLCKSFVWQKETERSWEVWEYRCGVEKHLEHMTTSVWKESLINLVFVNLPKILHPSKAVVHYKSTFCIKQEKRRAREDDVGHRDRKREHIYKEQKCSWKRLWPLKCYLHFYVFIYFRHWALPSPSELQLILALFSNLENCSSLGLFVTSCGKYIAKPFLGKRYSMHFFKHRCKRGFETELEIYTDGGEYNNSSRKQIIWYHQNIDN